MPWKATAPGALFKKLQPDYPEFEPVTEQGIAIVVGPDGIPQQQLTPSRVRFSLKHRSEPFLIQISDQILSINVLPPYPGWQAFKAELERRWPDFMETVTPHVISRIGLRYINRIARRSADESPNSWLRSNDYIAETALRSGPGFLGRTECRIDGQNRLLVTIAHDRHTTGGALHGALVLDIDRIVEREIAADWAAVEAEMWRLHDDVWKVFSSAKGDNLENLLRGEGHA